MHDIDKMIGKYKQEWISSPGSDILPSLSRPVTSHLTSKKSGSVGKSDVQERHPDRVPGVRPHVHRRESPGHHIGFCDRRGMGTSNLPGGAGDLRLAVSPRRARTSRRPSSMPKWIYSDLLIVDRGKDPPPRSSFTARMVVTTTTSPLPPWPRRLLQRGRKGGHEIRHMRLCHSSA